MFIPGESSSNQIAWLDSGVAAFIVYRRNIGIVMSDSNVPDARDERAGSHEGRAPRETNSRISRVHCADDFFARPRKGSLMPVDDIPGLFL
ncbi:MAG: hypothetical protein EPN70_01835 [Paraburkholderia sp.]|uniref:hypothetical protein n=1 Tax=Paraburkholderia sp. TaxID=1926495 RepID=UPI0011F492BB|nr:hypothetical protein [Paraburkholderia sp.]TAM07821.1 MAG: hypothetical protein EPN70_01835 [Paraburkholderia sp.]